jgi:hypothetical protein
MNRPDCAFAYSQARLQARLGGRIGAADWQRLHATRDLGALLQAAGNTQLANWTHEIDARTPVHRAEQILRRGWLASVDEVADWQPAPWRPAIAWLRWLPYLPALEKLARGGKASAWMRDDPLLGPIAAEDPRLRAASLEHTPCAPLAAGFTAPADVAGAWLRQWRALWPVSGARSRALERVVGDVAHARATLASAPPGARSSASLARLDQRLLATFRRHPLSPVASVAWLALAALDWLQLRGETAERALRVADETIA